MNTSLIKLAVALVAPAMIVSSTATGQGDKPLPPQDNALQPLTMEVVPSKFVSSAFTYQGQLRQNNLPVTGTCSAMFRLFDAETVGNQIGATVDMPTLQVQNGLFTVALDFGWGAFNGEARWLETAVGCGQRLVTLAPRTPLRAAPYALALPGMRTTPGSQDANGNATMNVIGGLVNGPISNTITPDSYHSVIAGGISNRTTLQSPYSFIGGGYDNLISGNNMHSVIAGGVGNRINDNSAASAIGGGLSNDISTNSGLSMIAGGAINRINQATFSVIASGYTNRISETTYAAIAGGYGNRIDRANSAAIAGGSENRIDTADAATIAGGAGNLIDKAAFAAIPGGLQAKASFWGQQAQAAGGFDHVPGTAQASTYILRNVTTNDQFTNLYLDGSAAEITVPLGRSLVFDVQVIGESDQATAFDAAAYHIVGIANNYGGFLVRSTTTVLYEDHSEYDAMVEAAPNNTLRIRVTGIANQNLRWVATMRTTEVEWPASATMNVQDAPVPEKK